MSSKESALPVKTVKWSTKKPSLNQIYQRGLELCFIARHGTDEYVQACDWVLCKDYFQDAIQASLINQTRSIYGFTYNPATDPALSFDRTRIGMANAEDGGLGAKIPAVLDFVNQFEKRIHLLRSRAFACDSAPAKFAGKSGCFVIEGSSRWLLSPPMISLYTLLLRVGTVHTVGTPFDETVKAVREGKVKAYSVGMSGSNDGNYLASAMPGIEKLVKHGYRRVFHREMKDNYPESVHVSSMHNYCGIVGFSSGSCKSNFPHWYRLDTKAPKKAVANLAA